MKSSWTIDFSGEIVAAYLRGLLLQEAHHVDKADDKELHIFSVSLEPRKTLALL